MAADGSRNNPGLEASVTAGGATEGAPALGGAASNSRGARWLICGGLVGGLLSWGLVESFHDHFQIPVELRERVGVPADLQRRYESGEIDGGQVMGETLSRMNPTTLQTDMAAATKRVRLQNVVLSLGLVGLACGSLLGLFAGLAGRSARGAAAGLVLGAILGGAFGVVGGWLAVALDNALKHSPYLNPSKRTILTQALAFGSIGMAVGLAAGILRGRAAQLWRPVGAAVVGGVAAAFVYVLLADLAFSVQQTDLAVPDERSGRLCWTLSAGVLMGVMLGIALSPRKAARTRQL